MSRVSERARGRLLVGGGLLAVFALAGGVILSELSSRRAKERADEGIRVETRDVEERAATAEDLLNGVERGRVLERPLGPPEPAARLTADGATVFVPPAETGGPVEVATEPDPFLVAQNEIAQLRAQELVDDYIKRRELRIAADEGSLAVNAGVTNGNGNRGSGGDTVGGGGLQQLAAALEGAQAGGGLANGGLPSSGIGPGLNGGRVNPQQVSGNGEAETTVASVSGYAQNPPLPPLSPYEVKKGSVIPAVLLTELVSDNPGIAIGQTTLPVFDSVTGRHELIPAGSKLHGRYGSDVSFGTERIGVVWTHLIFPDGRTLNLENAQGAGSNGASGLKDQVDTRFWETVGVALLTSFIGVGVELISPERSDEERLADEVRRGLGQNVGSALDDYVRRQADLAPRITIRAGARFNVLVENDFIVPPAR